MLVPDIFGRSVFDDFFMEPFGEAQAPRRMPMKTDVKETEGGYELDIELPGIKKEDIKVELREGYLTVGAETSEDRDEKDSQGRYICRERYSGSYSRSFYVGKEVTEEDIKARFQDGVLRLDVPKKEPKPESELRRLIQIED